MTYSEILARLESATGPDREINAMIAYASNRSPIGGVPFREIRAETEGGYANVVRRYACPHYTASLDAVTALIKSRLPGWWWQVGFAHPDWSYDGNSGVWGRVFTDTHGYWDEDSERGKTPTLALLTAAIRALADKEAA